MPIASGPQVATIAAGMGLIDAVAEQTGTKAPGAALSEELGQIQADVAGAVGPVVGDVVAWSLYRFGLSDVQLDSEHPFSDASLSGALSSVLGVPVGSIKDRAQLKDGFKRAVTAQASQQLGVPFGDIFDLEELRRDVLVACGQKVGQFVPGLALRDLSDKSTTIDDLSAYGIAQLSQALGVDFGDSLKNAASIREAVISWAMPKVAEKVYQEQANGTPYRGKLKTDRKSVLNRAAQAKFRERWGSLRTYEELPNG